MGSLSDRTWRTLAYRNRELYPYESSTFNNECCCTRPFSYIFKELLTLKKLSILLFSISLLTGLALLFTPIQAYVGLSGVLHGLFVWAAIEDIKINVKPDGYYC